MNLPSPANRLWFREHMLKWTSWRVVYFCNLSKLRQKRHVHQSFLLFLMMTPKKVTKKLLAEAHGKQIKNRIKKALMAKITVIGDSWRQSLTFPGETTEKAKRAIQRNVVGAGASRMFELVQAATGMNEKEIGCLYIPDHVSFHSSKFQIVAASLLKEYKPEKKGLENLRHLGFPEETIPKKPRRQGQILGATPHNIEEFFPFVQANEPEDVVSSAKKDEPKYLVIYDDNLHNQHLEGYKDDKLLLYKNVAEVLTEEINSESEGTINRWILWHPRRFADWDLRIEQYGGFGAIISDADSQDKQKDKDRIKHIKAIKQQTIVFLRIEDLADAGVGERGDGSIEECLDGILFEAQNAKNPYSIEIQKLLSGCAAIVIEDGVDSAFLVRLVSEGNDNNRPYKVTVHRIFFRTSRSDDAYRQNEGTIQGLSSFMVSSCLKALTEQTDATTHENLIARLTEGIKDGLWRMLVKFRIGYPVSVKGTDPKTFFQEHLESIYQLSLPSNIKNINEIQGAIERAKKTSDTAHQTKKEEELYQQLGLAERVHTKSPGFQRFLAGKVAKSAKKYHVRDVTPNNAPSVSATYISRFFRFQDQQLKPYLPLWLLEQQWIDLDEKSRQKIAQQDTNSTVDNHRKKEPWEFETQDGFLNAIVRCGLKTLEEKGKIDFPVARFGKMEKVEPDEISMFRRLNGLIQKYVTNPNDKKPLGLAVFGSPGSGKTSAIEAIATEAAEEIKLIECNLAQFKDPTELYKKFLEVRNYNKETSEKVLPILFLDEFDAKVGDEDFGWCKHLLSVLQDGIFRIEGNHYDIGKVLVVCAGGLCKSFSEFESRSWAAQSRNAKLPDLISRLRGYVDVAGPNPYFPFLWDEDTIKKINEELNPSITDPKQKIDPAPIRQLLTEGKVSHPYKRESAFIELAKLDPLYKIRRAVLLRSVLKKNMPFIYNEENEKLDIGQRVLKALLNISEYKYGLRSMQAVIEMSVSVGRDSHGFTSAMLPPPEQLEMHVDAKEFFGHIYGAGK